MTPITLRVAAEPLTRLDLHQCIDCDRWTAFAATALIYIDGMPEGVALVIECQSCGSTE